MKNVEPQVIWQPQEGPQKALIACPIFEVFYGGARGGGKTEGSIGDWLQHSSTYGSGAVGVFFRRTAKQLEEVIARTKELFPKVGSKWNEQKSSWVMPGGGRLKFRYLERDSDAEEYQGHSYTRVYVEEVTNFPSPGPINKLRATLRSARGVPTALRLTGNPGGPGHNWVKARYIDPAPQGWVTLREVVEGLAGMPPLVIERVFIPSKLRDNALLIQNDPFYVANLRKAGSEALVRAWLEGDWSMIDGVFFDKFDPDKHVLSTKDWMARIPKHSLIFRAFDWGFAKPFSAGWYAVSDGTWGLPNGALLKFQEWYGSTGKENVGVRMTADTVAEGIKKRDTDLLKDHGLLVSYGVADPSIFIRDGGPSIGETMAINGCVWRRADNKRLPGWAEMRRRFGEEHEVPGLYFLDCCNDSIRTIPTLQHDENNAEDLDTDGEDHAADETRYACMARPWTEYEKKPAPVTYPKLPGEYTINELIAQHAKLNKARREHAALG